MPPNPFSYLCALWHNSLMLHRINLSGQHLCELLFSGMEHRWGERLILSLPEQNRTACVSCEWKSIPEPLSRCSWQKMICKRFNMTSPHAPRIFSHSAAGMQTQRQAGWKIPQQLGIILLTVWVEASIRKDLLSLLSKSLCGFNLSSHTTKYRHTLILPLLQNLHRNPWTHVGMSGLCQGIMNALVWQDIWTVQGPIELIGPTSQHFFLDLSVKNRVHFMWLYGPCFWSPYLITFKNWDAAWTSAPSIGALARNAIWRRTASCFIGGIACLFCFRAPFQRV